MLSVDLDGQRLGLQAEAATGLARDRGVVALDLFARPGGFGLLPPPLEVRDHALERLPRVVFPQAVLVGEGHRVGAGAVEDQRFRGLGQVAPGGCQREAVGPGQGIQRLLVVGRGRPLPRRDRPAAERQAVVRYDELGVDFPLGAEAVADRAGTGRIVEGEEARLDLGDGEAGDRAGELRREENARGFCRGKIRGCEETLRFLETGPFGALPGKGRAGGPKGLRGGVTARALDPHPARCARRPPPCWRR